MRSLCLSLLLLPCLLLADDKAKKGEAKKAPALPYEVADFVEPEFPFFSSTLDCRDLGDGWPKDNLIPRGLIMNLGHNVWACYDIDLLRIACVWEAEAGKPPITLTALAPRSYKDPGQKTKDGQDGLPKPQGTIWAATGLHAGWDTHATEQPPVDPRPENGAPDIGRGPIPSSIGSFEGIAFNSNGMLLRLRIGQSYIVQRIKATSPTRVLIDTIVDKSTTPLSAVLGHRDASSSRFILARSTFAQQPNPQLSEWELTPTSLTSSTSAKPERKAPKAAPQPFWKETTKAPITHSSSTAPYVLDQIPLPIPNPWKRNVRLADIAFLDDQGNAAAVTMDGDVWLISGLTADLKDVTWKRFTSGLHEPMSLIARNNQEPGTKNQELLIYDRNGIWKLTDSDHNGECDTHELFCNLFTQTAETREFPSSMKLAPDGAFIISKGGQQGTRLGKDNGCVLRIAPDGKSYTTLAHGLRQPFIGVNEKTGLITSSDQQGHYVPSTPLHIIRDNQFYGHLATIQPKEQYPEPIATPLLWIPHPVNPSAVTQVWLHHTKLGPLDGAMLHLGYNRPEVFRVMLDDNEKPTRAAIAKLPLDDLDFPLLNAHVNPADGSLYLIGFQIWGTTAKQVSGLARMRYTGSESTLPRQITATKEGLLIEFDCAVDATLASDPGNYALERWNYKRTFDYGSAHYKLDGSIGQELIAASSAYVSTDKRKVFIGMPDMRACDQMHIGWNLKSAAGQRMEHNGYLTPRDLAAFDPVKAGFAPMKVDLTPRKAIASNVKPSVEEGQRLYQFIGCMGCHSIDGGIAGRLGPSWKGLYGSKRELADGSKVTADEAYIRESILDPSKKMLKAYLKLEAGMPIYAGILTDSQIESIILYMKTLAN